MLQNRINHVPCQERDRIILAFALAVNAQNNTSSSLEGAMDDTERSRMASSMEASKGYCHELRDLLLVHCLKHGC
jgi:hypothetical protein